ncbi:MAG: hypothetical protein PHH04_05375 [Thomasclavelia sp.]|jgi:hypothetical protein|nr:hypothetical protein [Thomasclavelia sp.]
MIKLALHSLKEDKGRAFFYWLTFLITTIFISSFFNLSFTKGLGFVLGKDDTSLITIDATLVTIVCMAVVFFANDFFVKRKSFEIAVDLMCGSTFKQLVIFLFVQTGIIFLLALPLGLIIGGLLTPLMNFMLANLGYKGVEIGFSSNAIIITISILLFEVGWCTLLNLGYVHRSTINTMMNGEEKLQVMHLPKMNITASKVLYILLFIVPLLLFFTIGHNPTGLLLFSIIGIFGIFGTITKVIIPGLKDLVNNKYLNDRYKMIYLGLLREDLDNIKRIIMLLIFSSIIFMSILAGSITSPVETVISFLSFGVAIILLSLAIMFKFASEEDKRKVIFDSMIKLGYLKKDIEIIKVKEVISLYGIILAFTLLYVSAALISLLMNNLIPVNIAIIIFFVMLIPIVLVCIINIYQYKQ